MSIRIDEVEKDGSFYPIRIGMPGADRIMFLPEDIPDLI